MTEEVSFIDLIGIVILFTQQVNVVVYPHSNNFTYTLKIILYLNPPKHELLNHLLIKSMNQPYYFVDSTKKFS